MTPTRAGIASPIKLSDNLPSGVSATGIVRASNNANGSHLSCNLGSVVSCEGFGEFEPYGVFEVRIAVSVTGYVGNSGTNEVTASGGGALAVANSKAVRFSPAQTGFGVDEFEQVALNEDGTPDTQAGSHPFGYTTTLQLNEISEPANDNNPAPEPAKDLHFDLPPGLVGNPTVIPQCTFAEFSTFLPGYANACPDDTAIGVVSLWFGPESAGGSAPVFNLVPNVGEPAGFGFSVFGVPVYLDTSVRSGGDYAVVVSVNDISTVLPFTASQLTLWGAPADRRHDRSRGWDCVARYLNSEDGLGPCPITAAGGTKAPPFLTLPTSCSGPLRSTVEADSWTHPGDYQPGEYTWHEGANPLGLSGCNRLPFEPSIDVTPDGQNASTPTGLAVTEHIPQEVTLNPTGLAESDAKETAVALPAGVQVSPAGGTGLLACSTGQVGFTGANRDGELEFSDESASCPEASKVGTVKVNTPLLPNPLKGAVYLAAQNANPFGSLVALYIVASDPVSGVLVKVAGEVALDPVTGQLVSTFKNTPQLPYEDLELHFFGSARAPLTTPSLCGEYTTHASITPWSGNPPTEPISAFQITAGPGGAACSSSQPFAPGFQAGSTNLQAGAFTPFTLTMSRPDADQTLSRVEMQMPPGLLGTLSTVKLCPEPQASQGTCSEESLIGHTVVSAGLGNDPYTVTGGKVFVTTGYGGAPYGLSIVNPAKAGPFDLGSVVVRASISVDPRTAALTIKSDPLPTIIDGIPLQIQHVNVTVDRDKFTFNPTNCNKTAINGTLSSTEGAKAAVSTSFQVTNCATLAFKPKLTASTSGKTSRANGASLHVKLTYPEGPYDANIAKVKVDLPKQLPSRLTTLQKACPAQVFDANPANCPQESKVATATATTPVLPVPLTGPAYFVSHGGEAFPDLIVVLQGYGATVDLVGTTFISKAGITSSTFKTVPDVPVGTFEMTLPQGKYSALAANGNLCKTKLKMPTSFVGQNGVEQHVSTPITVTNCTKHKKNTKKARHANGHKHKKK